MISLNSCCSRWANLVPLRYVFIIPFALLLLITVIVIGGLSWHTGHSAVDSLAHQLRQSISIRIQEHLNYYLDVPRKVNQSIQDAVTLNWLDVYHLDDLQQYFFNQLQLFESMSYIQLGNNTGQFIGLERHADNSLTVDIATEHTYGDMETYTLDTQGQRSHKPLSFVPDYNPREQSWYQLAAKKQQAGWSVQVGRSNWSEVFSFFGQTWLSITQSAPLFKNGQLVGVAAVDFTLDELSRFLHDLRVSPHGHTFIMERSGTLLASSAQEKLYSLSLIDKKVERLSALNSETPLIRHSAQFIQQQFQNFQQIREVVEFDYLLANERHFVKILPFHNYGLDWLIVVVVPEADFMAQINANVQITLWLAFFALLGSLTLSLIISFWVIRPITYLNQAARHLAQGTWAQLPIERNDELGELATSFNQMASQLKESFEHLEDKVAQRTEQLALQAQELAEANQHIQSLNEQLRHDNLRMGAELAVTRRLQQMVLPRAEELAEIKCLDIASFMEPATEVGGDYYDILQENGRIKIGIGDVTGHGLESGVLMLMVQTAVRTLLSTRLDPKEFLSVLNHAIYGNLQRMQSDKNLTLSLLDYDNGKLSLSGQHEDVLYVNKWGKIELIDTLPLGFMVGVEPDIDKFIAQREMNLSQGEGIVLYTDGITEAMNEEKQFYGLERLCRVVSEHWSQDATAIQQAVISDLRCHLGARKLQDDITLLVIKQREVLKKDGLTPTL